MQAVCYTIFSYELWSMKDMNILSMVGTPEQADSLLNILYPVDLSVEDECDADSLNQWELLGGQVSDTWVEGE